MGAGLIDDSYIFFRYARNFARGLGLAFNPGERVEGFTSPLWTIFLAAGARLGLAPDLLARAAGGLAGAAVALTPLATRSDRFDFRRSGPEITCCIILATSPLLAYWSAAGMETTLFTLLVTLSFISLLRDREQGVVSLASVALLLLASLTRMEALLLAGFAVVIVRPSARSVTRLALFGASICVCLLVRYLFFGSWLPNTFAAKVSLNFSERIGDGLRYAVQAAMVHLPLLALTGYFVIRVWMMRADKSHGTKLILAWLALWMTSVVFLGGDHFAMHRFILPILPALILLLLRSWRALETLGGTSARKFHIIALLVCAVASHGLAYYVHDGGSRARSEVSLAQAWAKTGLWLAQTTPEGTVIATTAIGAIGYFSERPLIDMLGLTDRTIAIEGRSYSDAAPGHGRYHTAYVISRSPELVIYPTSGRFEEPQWREPADVSQAFAYALYDLVNDPTVQAEYNYVASELTDGTWVEYQLRRDSSLPGLAQQR